MRRKQTAKKSRRASSSKSKELPQLTPEEIQKQVFRNLKAYKKLSALEEFAMFMGKAQVLEFGLKQLLVRLFNYDLEQMERWPMGRTIRELKESGLRADYVAVLEDLLEYRNYIAHEYLANTALLRRLLGSDIGRLEYKYLERGIFKIEEALLIHDWLDEHELWLPRSGDGE